MEHLFARIYIQDRLIRNRKLYLIELEKNDTTLSATNKPTLYAFVARMIILRLVKHRNSTVAIENESTNDISNMALR